MNIGNEINATEKIGNGIVDYCSKEQEPLPFNKAKKLFLKIVDIYINPYYNSICRRDDNEKTKKFLTDTLKHDNISFVVENYELQIEP
mgnify:FL=1